MGNIYSSRHDNLARCLENEICWFIYWEGDGVGEEIADKLFRFMKIYSLNPVSCNYCYNIRNSFNLFANARSTLTRRDVLFDVHMETEKSFLTEDIKDPAIIQ